MSSFFGSDDQDDIKDWNASGSSNNRSKKPVSKPTLPAQRPTPPSEEPRGLPTRKTTSVAKEAPARIPSPRVTPPSKPSPALPTQTRTSNPAPSKPVRPSPSYDEDTPNPRNMGLENKDYPQEREGYLEEELARLKKSRELEKESEAEEKEQSKSKGKFGGKRKKPVKKSKGDNNYAGGRRNIVIVRWTIIGLILVLAALGIKSVVAPPEFPSPAQILGVVDENLGFTEFPRDDANTFVLAFSKLYLNGPSDTNSNTARLEGLSRYAPAIVVDQLQTSYSNTDWNITDGPYVNNVTYTDNSNALFNVAAQINNGPWVYIDIPVFYNVELDSFAVSGAPGMVSAPNLTEIPGWPTEWTADTEILAITQQDIERFFQAWGEPGNYDLPAYSTEDASIVVQQGLANGAVFQSLSFVEVSTPLDEENPASSPREVRAEVVWGFPGTSRPNDQGVTEPSVVSYKSTYSLLIFPSRESDRWRVQDLKAGIRSTTGNLDTEATASPTAEASTS